MPNVYVVYAVLLNLIGAKVASYRNVSAKSSNLKADRENARQGGSQRGVEADK